MSGASGIQIFISALLSSGLVGGVITLLSKKVWSPESTNELARIGNEFAQQLLEEARSEREELRQTIKELEKSNYTKEQAIEKLRSLAEDKDEVIRLLEDRQYMVARKLQLGEAVTLQDIFGPRLPPEFVEVFTKRAKGRSNG